MAITPTCNRCCARVTERRWLGAVKLDRCSVTGRIVSPTAPCHLTEAQAEKQVSFFAGVVEFKRAARTDPALDTRPQDRPG